MTPYFFIIDVADERGFRVFELSRILPDVFEIDL